LGLFECLFELFTARVNPRPGYVSAVVAACERGENGAL